MVERRLLDNKIQLAEIDGKVTITPEKAANATTKTMFPDTASLRSSGPARLC